MLDLLDLVRFVRIGSHLMGEVGYVRLDSLG